MDEQEFNNGPRVQTALLLGGFRGVCFPVQWIMLGWGRGTPDVLPISNEGATWRVLASVGADINDLHLCLPG